MTWFDQLAIKSGDGSGYAALVNAAGQLSVSVDNVIDVTISGSVAVTQSGSWVVAVSNFPAVQAISATALPLPTNAAQETGGNLAALVAKDFATQTTLAALNAKVITVNTGAVVLTTSTAEIGNVKNSGTFATQAAQSGSWTVDVGNFPAVQPISGTVAVSNFPVTQAVTQSGSWTVTANAGTNLNTSLLALESGGNLTTLAGGVSAGVYQTNITNASVPVTGTFWQAVQPVSGTVTANQGGAPWTQNLTQVGGAALSLGQQTNAASLPVVLTAAQLSTITPPPAITGFATEATLAALNAKVTTVNTGAVVLTTSTAEIGNVKNSGTFATQATQAGAWNITNISGTVSLPTGAATSAKQPALGTAGVASTDVITVQGIASMVALKVDGSAVTQPVSGTVTVQQATAASLNATVVGTGTFATQAAQAGTWNITNISGTVSLPTGASTAAKQPALGTAGTASADVLTVQGIASMTALKVDGSAVTQPVSGTITANQGTANATPWNVSLAAETTKVIGTVNQGTSPWVISAASLPLPALAATSTKQSDGSQKTQIVDSLGNVIAATANALNVNIASAVSVTTSPGYSSGTGTITGSAQSVTISCQQFSSLVLELYGPTYAGAVLLFEQQLDAASGNWYPCYGVQIIAGSMPAAVSGVTPSSNANLAYQFTVGAAINFRVRSTAFTSGTLNVFIGETTDNLQYGQSINVNNTVTTTAAQSGTWTVQPGNTANTTAWLFKGGLTNNNAAPAATNNLGVLPVLANAAAPTWSEGFLTTLSSDLSGNLRTNVAQMNGVAVTMGNGASGTGVQRVTIASDSTGVVGLATGANVIGALTANQSVNLAQVGGTTTVNGGVAGILAVGGNVATNVAITANPINIAVQGVSSENAAVTTGRLAQLVSDLYGKLIVSPYAGRDNWVKGTASTTGTSDVSVVASAGGSLKNYMTDLSVANTGATTTLITIKDGSGGSTLWTTIAPAGGGSNKTFNSPIAGTAATAIFFAAGSSSTTVYCAISGFKGA